MIKQITTMSDIPEQMKYHKRVQRLVNVTNQAQFCKDNYPSCKKGGFRWDPDIQMRISGNGDYEEWIGYRIHLTEDQRERLEPYCPCVIHQMWCCNPLKYFLCRHCFQCLSTDLPSQENIIKAIKTRKNAMRYVWNTGEGMDMLSL